MEFSIIWDWSDIGIGLRVWKNTTMSNYKYSFDIYLLWFNIWIQFGKRK